MLGPCDDETRFKVNLLVSELVTNAVQHSDAVATDRIGVRVFTRGTRTRVEVSDPGRAEGALILPIPRQALASSGYGLRLLDLLADGWGVDQSRRTTVWFEVEGERPSIVERLAG